jgi:histidinol-phosphatase (PHP family)
MLFDTHTHTRRFSSDSRLDIGTLLDRASELGLAGVAVTDHYEPDYPDPSFSSCFDIPEYLAYLRASDRGASGGPRVLRGLEFGFLPFHGPRLDEIVREGDFDAIISSVHMLGGLDPYYTQDVYAAGRKAVYGGVLEQMAHMLRATRSFDVLGHFDYFSRYAPFPDKKMKYRDAPDAFDEVFRLCIGSGRSLELNTRTGYRLQDEGDVDWLPDPDILRRYRELGGELVSLGSDAHQVEAVGRAIPEYRDWLSGLGFPRITVFIDRKPVLF